MIHWSREGPRGSGHAQERRMEAGCDERQPPSVQALFKVWARNRKRQPRRRHAEGNAGLSQEAGRTLPGTAMKKLQYLVRISKDPDSDWGASVPDLPGCVATGKTLDATLRRIQAGIELHLQGMRQDGIKAPRPRHRVVTPKRTSGQVDFYATIEVA